ncbi:PEP-CTERM sorting domain-containing protein [Desertifilum sp. FACHB-1129]|uniref:PEP-CTERM protein-sorting domain-containing protein n=1 Tax=Desertifilum tharense IPPAS B-1220 TaxID=1781255 RepID=A0A1E5QIG1_9CYAN|nr:MULTISPECIES: choice-of-anchor W domain-containing protein [Desertifilum]MDA0210119.1 PEP-CTERM sorting domain-containing protein [Cyanobacteria bacterium FC1]MBD2312576.1 PEP-CTERM sorting domain-containing protein [Desertifilum sp. FACHB-1129]MBD2320524.1 PEP-CTERM sorting domain-containing protein [Desertifilum sp. FACHB-866]MBD2330652.1 PEP-CTERM sorting domain-containing protein [Desertifilum sp. FACHB-868]OEJ74450.1 hypothetical protein BH720_14600 [Desertifilum tharense IPPAS B-1220]
MIKNLRFVYPVLLATLGVTFAPATANAISFIPRPDLTDSQFQQLIDSGKFTETFVAQGRIGNNALNGTQEFDLLDADNNLLPVAQGQRIWETGEAVDFTLEYTGSLVNYWLGGELLSSDIFSGPFTDLFLRTRATGDTVVVMLSDLFLNGIEIPGLISASSGGANEINYLQITDVPDIFTLVGKATLAWANEPPQNSQLAYQIKVGRVTPDDPETVPEPSLVLSLAGGAALMSFQKRKRKSGNPSKVLS